MPRANRYFIPGYIWHITHRCHKKEFLLKFGRDKQEWIKWLFESKKRYSLEILNYTITSNHIHLLVRGDDDMMVIPKSIKLIAGCTAQKYNKRKNRKGAFWEDRYHATAIQSGNHLLRCMIYIDMNMVRAGVVSHPSEWEYCGYKEILNPRNRYSIINHKALLDCLQVNDVSQLQKIYPEILSKTIKENRIKRDEKWTLSVAVGDGMYIKEIKEKLGLKVKGRDIEKIDDSYCLQEPQASYNANFDTKNDVLRPENGLFWDITY
ncbi:MAG: transposase [Candidatus Omnitrophica bacterium]|nr:transposase [Candidatus Omnitrophota bacterium]